MWNEQTYLHVTFMNGSIRFFFDVVTNHLLAAIDANILCWANVIYLKIDSLNTSTAPSHYKHTNALDTDLYL